MSCKPYLRLKSSGLFSSFRAEMQDFERLSLKHSFWSTAWITRSFASVTLAASQTPVCCLPRDRSFGRHNRCRRQLTGNVPINAVDSF